MNYFLSCDGLNVTYCNVIQDQSQLKNKETELKKMTDLLTKLEGESTADTKAVQVAQDHYHAVSAGLSSNEGGEDKTLADQIMSKCLWHTQNA